MISQTGIPVLTYHAARIDGNDYGSNDHHAFYQDLRLLTDLGFKVVALKDAVRLGCAGDGDAKARVAISFDDGTDFDYLDLPHPTCGMQRSMLNIMRDFVAEFGATAQPALHATSFVIASPLARMQLDRTCLVGREWYTDGWWLPAIESGYIDIANHSWDHLHPTLDTVAQRHQEKGSFIAVDTYADADAQIRRATDYLMSKTQRRACRLFAYPYGHVNDYLPDKYLPGFGAEHGLDAAFTTSPGVLSRSESIWRLPRFVCGLHWTSPGELAALLRPALTA